MGIAVLVKSAAYCEQKTHRFSTQAVYSWIGFSEENRRFKLAEGVDITERGRIYFANTLRTMRFTGN